MQFAEFEHQCEIRRIRPLTTPEESTDTEDKHEPPPHQTLHSRSINMHTFVR
jgi:hypothetical protein